MRMRCSCKCHLPARPRRLHARPRRILCSSASNAAAMDSTPAPEAGPGASSSATAAAISTASSNPLLLRLQRCCHGLHAGTRGGPRRLFRQDLAGGVAVMTLEECIQEDELRRLLDNKPVLICYDGFEPPDACTSLRAL